MSNSTYAIRGIPVAAGQPIPTRKEITAWSSIAENDLQVSLFIQALAVFQKLEVTDQLSYFRVAGIHGYPQASWDGVTDPSGFYCNHQLPTFPCWHRSYLLLFEQRLYEIMLGIISDSVPVDQQKTWTLAASQWRLPYWDWAAPQPYIKNYGVPQLLTQQKINIILPGSKLHKVPFDNPLWKFSNPSGVPMGDKSMGDYAIPADAPFNWNECVATSRHGIVSPNLDPQKKWVYGVENWPDTNKALQNPEWSAGATGTIGEMVYRLYTKNYFSSWEYFASTKYYAEGSTTDYLSLEFIHNNIHVFTGGADLNGGGHMCDVPVAAFDPIFWLHHCNVDRQTAIFQSLNPSLWFDHPDPAGDDPGPSDPLQPFHYDTNNSTYNSAMVRDWKELGYSYDELSLSPPTSNGRPHHELAVQPDIHHAIQPAPALAPAVVAASATQHSSLKRALNKMYGNTRKDLQAAPEIEGRQNDYIINIIYDRYALNGSPYTLHFFLGNPDPAEISAYSTAANHIGCVYTFSSRLEINATITSGCRNCAAQKKAGVLSTAQVPITSTLLHTAKNIAIPDLTSLNPEGVENYLTQNMTWRAVEIGGRLIDMSELPATKVFVMKGTGDHPEDDAQLSHYHSYTPMWDITRNKVGGAGPNDGLVPASGA